MSKGFLIFKLFNFYVTWFTLNDANKAIVSRNLLSDLSFFHYNPKLARNEFKFLKSNPRNLWKAWNYSKKCIRNKFHLNPRGPQLVKRLFQDGSTKYYFSKSAQIQNLKPLCYCKTSHFFTFFERKFSWMYLFGIMIFMSFCQCFACKGYFKKTLFNDIPC